MASLAGEGRKQNQALLYKLFGMQAEYLIDHAWGYEPGRIQDIHAVQAKRKSLSEGQVLPCPYDAKKGRIVTEEMALSLSFTLVEKGLGTELVELYLSFDEECIGESYLGERSRDYFGKVVPKGVHGYRRLAGRTDRERELTDAILSVYDEIMDKRLSIRKIALSFEDVRPLEKNLGQLDLFHYLEEKRVDGRKKTEDKEERIREASLHLMHKYGKNAVLKAYQYVEGARGRERNKQIGGHSSGV